MDKKLSTEDLDTMIKVKIETREYNSSNLESTAALEDYQKRMNESRTTIQKSPKKAKSLENKFNVNILHKNQKVIDLSNLPDKEPLLPGPKLDDFKEKYTFFTTYDPRAKYADRSKEGYCSMCGNPINYCADVVFGEQCVHRAEYILLKRKKSNVVLIDCLHKFQFVYTRAVYAKPWTNMVDVEDDFHKDEFLQVPKCIFDKRVPGVIKKVTDMKDKKGTIIWSPCKTKWMHTPRMIRK